MKKRILNFLVIAGLVFSAAHASAATSKLIVFFSPGCHHCIYVRQEIMPGIEQEYRGKIAIEYRDIDDIENYKMLLALEEKYHAKVTNTMPVFCFGGRFINGEGNVGDNLKALLSGPQGSAEVEQALPKVDLVKRFQRFTPLALIAVGLIDGINPCAVTVIVFFMSFLSLQGYRKREILLIGLIFIGSVYLTYVLIGLGIFQALYSLQGFWLLTKIINITVGSISILFSIYALYDFIQYRRSKSPMICSCLAAVGKKPDT